MQSSAPPLVRAAAWGALLVACSRAPSDHAPAIAGPTAGRSDRARVPVPEWADPRPRRLYVEGHPPGTLVFTALLVPGADTAAVEAFRRRTRRALRRLVAPPQPELGALGEAGVGVDLDPGYAAPDSARVAAWLARDPLVVGVRQRRW